ncbi:MAG: PKD domain-containing protein, partial [Phaeodactylibacter sp.]|nr:PKD domain-containing protein [Phaeodactylibacter sp.]
MPTLTKAAFLAILWLAPALLWSTTAYHWDEPGCCQWQEQETQQRELDNWQWRLLAGDTLRPTFATHACDLICPDFQVNRIVVDANCGQNDGSATIEPVGYPAGTVFSYAWSGNVSTTNEADSLPAGIYFVSISVVVSGNGSFRNCDTETIVPVSDVGGPEVSVSTVSANCMSEAGRVRLDITSGTPPFTISWTGGTRTAGALGPVQFVNLAAGTYTFLVADANGCKTAVVADVPRDNSGMFDVFLNATPASGCGASDGTLTVNINGGFPPFEITLNNLNSFTTSNNPYTFTNLPPGLYRVKVTDVLQCEEERDIVVTDGSPPCNNCWTAVDADCSDAIGYLVFDGCGAAHETFEVRQKNSTFIIQTVAGNSTATIEVPAGDYRIKRVSSQDACICEFKLTVEAPEELTAEVEVVDDCAPDGTSAGSITVVEITGGTPPYTELITDSLGNPVSNPNNLPPGIYTITITDANNCQPLVKEVEIEGCPCGPITVTASPADTIICEGESVTLQAVVTSPDPPGSITWFDENDTEVGTGAALPVTPDAGIHQYTVVAQSSCSSDTDTATVRVKVAENASLAADPDYLLVCTDDPVTIDVSGPLSECVIWLNSAGEPVDTGIQLMVIPEPGRNQYIATLPGAENCVVPDTVTVEYRTETVDVTVSGPTKVCEGDSVCLLAAYTPNDATVSISWTDINGIPLGNDPELCVTPSAGIQQYIAIASNGCSSDSDTAVVTVLADTTKIEITPADTVT